MTPAKTDHTLTPWYAQAGAACRIVPIARFVGPEVFALKTGGYATVRSVEAKTNIVTVEREDGAVVSYDPKRLKGVNVYREVQREIAVGERIQFTGQHKSLGLANRDLGTVTNIEPQQITVKMDGKDERVVTFDPTKMRHFEHGYAVTSYSAQGLTAGSNRLHLLGPLLVVVGATGDFPIGLLPDVNHLMGKGGEDEFVASSREHVRVHRQLMRCAMLCAAGEAVRCEVTLGLGVTLQGDEYMGKGSGEEFGVQEVIGGLKGTVLPFSDCDLAGCIVRNKGDDLRCGDWLVWAGQFGLLWLWKRVSGSVTM